MDAWQSVSGGSSRKTLKGNSPRSNGVWELYSSKSFQICGPKTSTLNFLSQGFPYRSFQKWHLVCHTFCFMIRLFRASSSPLLHWHEQRYAWPPADPRELSGDVPEAAQRGAHEAPLPKTGCFWDYKSFPAKAEARCLHLSHMSYYIQNIQNSKKTYICLLISNSQGYTIVQQTKVSLTPRPRNLTVGSKVWTLCMRCTSPLREWERKITSLPYCTYPPSTTKAKPKSNHQQQQQQQHHHQHQHDHNHDRHHHL